MINKATIGPLHGKKPGTKVEHDSSIHRHYLNPKQIAEGKANGHVIHDSGHVFYHDPERNDFYLHPSHFNHPGLNVERPRGGSHRAYLKKNSKTAINSMLKS